MNLIDAADGAVGRVTNGPMHRFVYSRESSFTMVEIEKILRQYGVRIWGRDLGDEKEGGFTVRKGQAVWAEYVLMRAGVTILSPLAGPRYYEPGPMPTAWAKPLRANNPVGAAVDGIGAVAGVRVRRSARPRRPDRPVRRG